MPDWVYFHSMADIRDYLNWRGDLSFDISPLNEVDGLILSYLSYLEMDDCFSGETESPEGRKDVPEGEMSGPMPYQKSSFSLPDRVVPLSYAVEQFFRTHTEKEIAHRRPPFNTVPYVARQAARTKRFGSLMVSDYVNLIDDVAEEQMAAMIFWVDTRTAFASFRGTDNTIVGWKEDFNLGYLRETPGQRHAVDFLNKVFEKICAQPKGSAEQFAGDPEGIKDSSGSVSDPGFRIYVGGHSQGGNFAVYGAAFAGAAVRNRIIRVFANDSPGFRKEIVDHPAYRKLLPKIVSILPDSSIIGGLLLSESKDIVIASNETGLMQHDALSWQVLGTSFIRAERSDLGRFFDISLRNWIGSMTDEEMKDFTDALFGMLSAGGARTLSELRKDPLRTVSEIFKVSKNMSPEEFQEFTSVIVRLVKSGLTTFREQSEEKITAVVAGAGTNAQKSRSKTGGKGRTKSGKPKAKQQAPGTVYLELKKTDPAHETPG